LQALRAFSRAHRLLRKKQFFAPVAASHSFGGRIPICFKQLWPQRCWPISNPSAACCRPSIRRHGDSFL